MYARISWMISLVQPEAVDIRVPVVLKGTLT